MISDARLEQILRSRPLVRLVGDLVRGCLLAAVLIVAGGALLYQAALVRFMVHERHFNDFGKFYYSARAFTAGGDMYGPTPATSVPIAPGMSRDFWNMNPPHFHLVMLPIAALEPAFAFLVWAAASAAALMACLRVIGTELAWRWTPVTMLWAVAAVSVCSATGMNVVTGQLTLLLMLPVTLAWRAARHDGWRQAGAWMGLAAAIKPFLGVFLLYAVICRRFAAARWMVGAGAAVSALGLVVFGPAPYLAWLRVLRLVDWTWAPMNGSVHGVLTRTLTHNPLFEAAADVPHVAAALAMAISIAIVVWTVWRLRTEWPPQRASGTEAHADRAWLALLLAAMLASPLGWFYYLPLAAGPLAACFARARRGASRLRDLLIAAALPGLIVPLSVTGLWRESAIGTLTLASLYGWTTLALWGAVMIEIGAHRRVGVESTARAPRQHAVEHGMGAA